MPFWWARKGHQKNNNNKEEEHHHSYNKAAAIKNEKKKGIDKPKSFDEVFPRNSPRTSKDFFASAPAGAASGVVGCYNSVFDSDGGGVIMEKRGHPLPRPSVSSAPSLVIDLGVGLGSGSVSGSSVSSSGSSDDPPDHGLFGGYRAYGETKFNPRSRSPGPGSRGVTASTSPLHPRLSGLSLESPTGKQEDGKSPCHPLPLPPGSPTNPCTSPTFRTSGANENSQSLQSKWKKGRLLGRGTFGHVYFGFNSDSGQMCAIKEVRIISDDQSSKECLNQLNQEITLLSQLLHPNIVQYYGSELGEETLSVYLEFVSGGSIHKLLQEYGPFNEPVIQNYTRQILSGLNYLHGRNTVHRDIKGANILVDPNGGIKLADFGMAKHITSYSSMLSFKGSPYWMAPEVIMNTSGYSLAVDIWSLGCTVLEMATSKPPWGQYEGVAAIFKIGNSRDIPEIPDHLSYDAKNFLRLCLQRDPSARPTAAQLLNHPFVRDLAAVKVPKINIINDTFPSTIDGNYTQIASDFHSNKINVASRDVDYGMKTTLTSSEASRSPRRRNMSLPVSPCSSPLRHYTPAYKSCLVSPPHPAYTLLGSSYYGLNDYPVLSPRPNTNYPADPWRDINQLKAQTPGGSPRSRYI